MTPQHQLGSRRPRQVLLGAVVWLVLASSITLEQGQDTAARWGSTATVITLGILLLLLPGTAAITPLRRITRRARRRIIRRPK